MIAFQNKDERLKIITYVFIALLIQGIVFYIIFYSSIKSINSRIINQNFSILSFVNNKDSNLARDIVPIITGKIISDSNSISNGEEILSKYSYDDSLNYKNNPLIGTSINRYMSLIGGVCIITLLIISGGIIWLINPLYKEIKYLTYRAETILENKNIEDEMNFKYRGSLDKFILKFSMMEERIHNSMSLLNEEKINLKNIINDISHQLKTPLMALSMYNEILTDHRNMEYEDIDNFIDSSNEQLDRMEWLVKTLLKYARLESNVVEYHKESFSLNNTIEESISPLKVKASEKKQELSFKYDKQINFYHDRKWIAEALSNIIKNAIEHTDVNGKIEVGVEETPITIRVYVKDNGEGIDKDEIKKIFNRFYKGENSINPTSIGIGLCLSKAIVKAHNGDITVESEVGKGSIFYITFIKSIY
ncbi:HAMP domain-containing sensor histidine kinase [Clostridium sp. D53t1_180928_C8]|uniref:sensor histidine kinase n=1 Tax=Clostridium sp. D53t1_180928_C8 TaxID=2787101 RepID=UPI0018AC88E3|nr:HAMP domain-containing sensor histidine kinase [Clostridium sp. D53t1_180928_C8]